MATNFLTRILPLLPLRFGNKTLVIPCNRQIKGVIRNTLSESEIETGPSTGSGRVDRPVKPVEKPVKFSFLATKRRLSTNQNILKYLIINKTYKKSVLTNHTFRKHLLSGFKL